MNPLAYRLLSDILTATARSRMFSVVSRTWNPISGCLHNCRYCWARHLAETKLRNTRRYREGFKPRLNREELRRRFAPGELVFVSDMGDMWGEWVPAEWIEAVLRHIAKFPHTWFLFLTKNPARYHEFLREIPPNCILGATIETNRDDVALSVSRAPPPSERYRAMVDLDWPLKFVSIEPILDLDPEVMSRWILDIEPVMVYVGYDNYDNRLPEPPLGETRRLLSLLDGKVIVIRKTIRPAWHELTHGRNGAMAPAPGGAHRPNGNDSVPLL